MRTPKLDLPRDADPEDFLLAAFRSDAMPLVLRMQAAAAVAPFVHAPPAPKLVADIAPGERVVVILGGLPQGLPALPSPPDHDEPDDAA
jgi:hypothetical protein